MGVSATTYDECERVIIAAAKQHKSATVTHTSSHGLTDAAARTGIPMAFGVLTTNNVAEAVARAGDGPENKGREAASAALDMASVVAQLRQLAG